MFFYALYNLKRISSSYVTQVPDVETSYHGKLCVICGVWLAGDQQLQATPSYGVKGQACRAESHFVQQ